jgi:uncharacterized Ntn-hydrolase superfamily protein
VATFSIVARDPANGDLGVAVASKFLAVGAVVPWAQAGVGAIATQSWANTSYGPRGLRLLAQGLSAAEALERLVRRDKDRAQRQAGIVDAQGRAATYTGTGCYAWAGGLSGPNFACQGNILVSEATIQAMAETFQRATGDLAERLFTALAAGQEAGGDSRGRQSAALLVVRPKGGYGGWNDRYLDLRVDDSPQPVVALGELLKLHRLYLNKSDPKDLLPIDAAIARELQALMQRTGDYRGPLTGLWDEATQTAFRALAGRENLEERLQEGPQIDAVVLRFLRERFK